MALQHPQRSRWVIVLVLLLTLWQRSQHSFTLQELGALLMRPLAQPIVRKASSLALQYRAATDFTLQKVNLMTPEMSVQKHAKKLTKRIFWGNWIWQMLGPRLGKRAPMKNIILPFDKQFLADPMNDTPFETLMRDVLQARDVGTTAVFAEPGIGKSVSTVLAVLKTNASESCMTVLLRGEFQKSLKDFFRVPDTSLALNVANSFFSQIASDGISLCIIIDNAFDGGLQGDSTALLDLTRHAFEFGHQLVVVTQSSNLAAEINELNGVRTKIAPQQDGKRAEDFRWSEDLARQYLTRSVMTDVKKRQDISVDEVMREWLNATKMRDGSGGWSPSTMSLYTRGYLSLGEAPPTRGSAVTTSASVVWVRELIRKEDGIVTAKLRPKEEGFQGEDEPEQAFQVSPQDHPRLNNVDDLKAAIKQRKQNTLKDVDADQIDIYLQEAGEWQRITGASTSLRQNTSEQDCYGFEPRRAT